MYRSRRGSSAASRGQQLVRAACASVVALALAAGQTLEARAQQPFDRTRDRGPGIPTSLFGTYVAAGELLFYPFFEYYLDRNYEYKPQELGFGVDQDFRGDYRASEGLIFLGYGISDRLALELEAAVIEARLEKSPADPSLMPDSLEESGLGDVAAQLRWRWNRETETRGELFSYFETTFPFQRNKRLIGTQDWEFKFGTGIVRGLSWGTMTLRAAVEYAENQIGPGEYAVEYLKRVSPAVRLYTGVEGVEDEIEWISEVQLFLRRNVFLKLNNAFGLTSKAPDWAPEIGIMFVF
jgi:hypothetical protein